MIKFLIFNKLGNFNKFTKLNKNFKKFDDKFIIQYFYHIHIYTLICLIYYLNFSILKNI